jgi:signal transduction histidine kinase
MSRGRFWFQVSRRVFAAMLGAIVLIAAPVFALLFVGSPLNPWLTRASWGWGEVALRVGGALAYLGAISTLIGYGASRGMDDPFAQLADSIRRIATRDFGVRLGPFKFREPHELVEVADAFNTMAAELERSEELRNTLMADVSHELRTPLTVLEGNLRAALDRVYPLDEAAIANLYGQTRHLIRLVNDLHELALADARRLPLALEPTELAALLEETVQLFMPLGEERGVALSFACEPLPLITVDAVRIRQVLHNVLSNALRHTPAGGAIRVSGAVEDASVVIAIADSGDGLEPDQLHAVFDRFYRTDKSRSRDTGGTGLGLAIVNALVATHGGAVAASSAGRGKGTTLTIRLPVSGPGAQ